MGTMRAVLVALASAAVLAGASGAMAGPTRDAPPLQRNASCVKCTQHHDMQWCKSGPYQGMCAPPYGVAGCSYMCGDCAATASQCPMGRDDDGGYASAPDADEAPAPSRAPSASALPSLLLKTRSAVAPSRAQPSLRGSQPDAAEPEGLALSPLHLQNASCIKCTRQGGNARWCGSGPYRGLCTTPYGVAGCVYLGCECIASPNNCPVDTDDDMGYAGEGEGEGKGDDKQDVPLPLAPPSPQGPYTAANASVKIPGLVTGASNYALMTFPAAGPSTAGRGRGLSGGPFPVIAFAHGMAFGGGLMSAYLPLMLHVASHGFVVIGPKSCEPFYCDNQDVDVLHTVAYAKAQGAALHPALGPTRADFSRMGALGHSMGGAATVKEAGDGDKGSSLFKAAFALNPSSDAWRCKGPQGGCGADVHIPIAYATGTDDIIVAPEVVRDTFKRTPAPRKALFNMAGVGHMEPTAKGDRWDPYVSAFLRCEVAGDATACPLVWGNATGSLCASHKMEWCDIQTGA